MSVRSRTYLIIFLVMLCVVILLSLIAGSVFLRNAKANGEAQAFQHVNRAVDAMKRELRALDEVVTDYASWDDTYAYVQNPGAAYIEANYLDETFSKNRFMDIIILDERGKTLFQKGFDAAKGVEGPVTPGLLALMNVYPPMVRHATPESYACGLLMLPEGIFLASSRPVITSSYTGPVRGTMIITRVIGPELVQELSKQLHLPCELLRLDHLATMAPVDQAALKALSPDSPMLVKVGGRQSMFAYGLLTDITDKPALALRVTLSRDFYVQALWNLAALVIAVTLSGAVMGLLAMWLLDRMILTRLLLVNDFVRRMTAAPGSRERLALPGNDELVLLGNGVNDMLDALEREGAALQKKTEELDRFFRLSPDLLCIFGMDGRFRRLNPAWESVLGHHMEDLLRTPILDFVHPRDSARTMEILKDLIGGREVNNFVNRFCDASGKYRWLEWRSSLSTNRLIYAVARDITDRAIFEEALRRDELRVEALLKLHEMGGASIHDITEYALDAALRLTDSAIGYLAFANEDESVLTMYSWSQSAMAECRIVDKPLDYPVADTGLWGEAVRQRRPVITNDYAAPSTLKKGCPEGHVALRRHMNVPIFDGERVVIVAGVGNKQGEYDEGDVRQLTLLMQGMWRLVQRRREEEARAARLQRIQRQQTALTSMATAEDTWSGDFNRAMTLVTRLVADCFEVDRASIWLETEDTAHFHCVDLFERPLGTHSSGFLIAKELLNDEHAELLQKRFVAAVDAVNDPRTACLAAKYLEPLKITSILDAAIRISEYVAGIVCVESRGPLRIWHEDEIAFAGAVGDHVAKVHAYSERKQSEELLLRQGAALEQSLDGIAMTNLEGVVQYANPAWAGTHGCQGQDLCGRHLREFHTLSQVEGELTPFVNRLLQTGSQEGVIGHCRVDGSTFPARTDSFVLRDGSGIPLGLIWFARDITNEIKLEEQLRQAQKMEAVGQLAGGVAHDFNNLLQAIAGYTELARGVLASEGRPFEELEQVTRATERATTLVRQLLTFSRRQTLTLRPLRLDHVVSDVTKMLRRVIGEHLNLETTAPGNLWLMRGDPGHIEQILMNLCVNARDAMPEGGKIRIETSNAHLDSDYQAAHSWGQPGDYVQLTVSDNGAGMRPEVLEHVFEPFFTTKEVGKGTGLGLATVYGIVKQHSGFISVYSEPGHGTVFKLYFPVTSTSDAPAARSPETPAAMGGNETILLAEDDELVRNLAVRILTRAGYRVIEASDGAMALEHFSQHGDEIQLCLLDVVMPRKSGKAVYEHIARKRPKMPVLFSSGYSFSMLSDEIIPDGKVDLIQKPYNPSTLLRKVREKLDRFQSGA